MSSSTRSASVVANLSRACWPSSASITSCPEFSRISRISSRLGRLSSATRILLMTPCGSGQLDLAYRLADLRRGIPQVGETSRGATEGTGLGLAITIISAWLSSTGEQSGWKASWAKAASSASPLPVGRAVANAGLEAAGSERDSKDTLLARPLEGRSRRNADLRFRQPCSLNKSAPIVVVTGHDNAKIMQEAFAAGATFFLQKPVDRQRLTKLFKATRGRMLENRRQFVRVPLHTEVICQVNIKLTGGRVQISVREEHCSRWDALCHLVLPSGCRSAFPGGS
jgi:CheY-like chemotaxis protein